MHTRRIADVEVSAIGLGGMPLSLAGRPGEEDAIRVIHAALDAGMTFIDTADVYCIDDQDLGHNERLIARALRERPAASGDSILVATKGGLRRPGGAWVTDARPERLVAACDASLRALGVEAIDLYQLHAPDKRVPLSDSVGALAELARAGKIRRIGLSNVSVAEIEEARAIVEIASVQNRCNPLDTASFESGVVAYCTRHGIAFLPHSPVGGHRGHVRVAGDPALAGVAERRGATSYQVCLAFLLALSPVMIPIPGASRPGSARASAAAADLVLTEQDLAELAAAFPRARVA
jgi:aryl-alcohol dehydrogenase-like predicted oxidoreductase